MTQIWHSRRAWGYSIRTARYRYTEWLAGKAGRELYDHSRDADEVHNLAEDPAYRETILQLSEKLQPYVRLQPHKRAANSQ